MQVNQSLFPLLSDDGVVVDPEERGWCEVETPINGNTTLQTVTLYANCSFPAETNGKYLACYSSHPYLENNRTQLKIILECEAEQRGVLTAEKSLIEEKSRVTSEDNRPGWAFVQV